MQHLLLIALGGMAGALSRYGLSKFIMKHINDLFPWGTLVVNLSGSFCIGMVYEMFERSVIPTDLRSLVTIGFLGAYTTFSTYGLETINLLREGEYWLALGNLVLSNGLGLTMVVFGLYSSRLILKLFM